MSAKLLQVILFLPFLAALLSFLNRLLISNLTRQKKLNRFIAVITPTLIAFITLYLFFTHTNDTPLSTTLFSWLHIGSFHIELSLLFDRLSTFMSLFITLISMLIFIYATGYMKEDASFSRFFIYFHLFLGSMLLLVLADNPLVMFLGWEGVGVCSYLLIGFYFKESHNLKAANKAFYLNRIGDFGFVTALGLLLVSLNTPYFDYEHIALSIQSIEPSRLTLIGLLLFVGAMGKSAQIPLYVWLPDAMAGPTPVSALIHAATMVTAGVYMVVRFHFIYELIPHVGLFIAYIGAFSALLAALFASFESDIKKILAYSTMSQLGYMFIAAGLGAYSASMFHLFSHAFFKALLFMGAGAVIIAMHHEQNIFKMGKLHHFIPLVSMTMFIATLALSGIPPFSGFISKDAIIAHSFFSGHYTLWALASLTAFLTAYYMFRLIFSIFFAQNQKPHTLHMLPLSMQWPLVVLALFATFGGFFNLPHFMGGTEPVTHFLALPDRAIEASFQAEWSLTLFSVLLSLLGMLLAYKRFAKRAQKSDEQHLFKRLFIHKLYIDRLYYLIFAQGLFRLSSFFIQFIEPLFKHFVYSLSQGYKTLATVIVRLQNGDTKSYMHYLFLGVVILSIYLISIFKALL